MEREREGEREKEKGMYTDNGLWPGGRLTCPALLPWHLLNSPALELEANHSELNNYADSHGLVMQTRGGIC